MSAASMALFEPICPMAIPMSALFITGASFIPSPANAVILFFDAFSYSLYLSCGNIWYFMFLIPNSLATFSASSFLSPVNIIVSMFCLFRYSIVSLASSFMPPVRVIDATCLLFMFTWMLVSMLQSLHIFLLPILTFLFPISYSNPSPDVSLKFFTFDESISLLCSSKREAAIG